MPQLSPIASNPADRLDRLGEVALLAHVPAWLGPSAPPPPHGPGDDAAVLPPSATPPNVVTVDSVIRGRHFDDALAPEHVGAKLAKRNLSDLAAMGAAPGGAVLALNAPDATSVAWLERFFRGLGAAAHAHGLTVVGGDVAATAQDLVASLTVWGHAARPLLRTGVRAGDTLWVTGELGATLPEHHWTFTPRLAEGAWLADQTAVHAMIDVTDGLGKDLPTLLGPDLAAELDLAALPARAGVPAAAAASGRPALWHLLNDGEDYELLFALDSAAAPAEFARAFAAAFPGTRLSLLGHVIPRAQGTPALRDAASGRPLDQAEGYTHFRPAAAAQPPEATAP